VINDFLDFKEALDDCGIFICLPRFFTGSIN